MRIGLDKGKKVRQHSSINTLIEVATNTMALKHTELWLAIEWWVDVGDIDNDKVFDTKPSHSHPPHPTTNPTPISSFFTLKLKPPAFCPFHNTHHPSPFAHCVHATLLQPHNIAFWRKKEHIGFDTHKTVPHKWGTSGWADIDKCWWPPHDTHFHTIHQSKPTLFHSLSTLSQHTLAWGHSAIVPTSLFGQWRWHSASILTDRTPQNGNESVRFFSVFQTPFLSDCFQFFLTKHITQQWLKERTLKHSA